MRPTFLLAILLAAGCIEEAPSSANSEDVGFDLGSSPDARMDAQDTVDSGDVIDEGIDMIDQGMETSDAGRDSGVDAGFEDAGIDAGPEPFYASPVVVDDFWDFEQSLASNRGTFESPTSGFTDGIDGTFALEVAASQWYTLDNTTLGLPEVGGAFSVGGWIRHAALDGGSTLFSRGVLGVGGWALTYKDGAFNCLAVAGETITTATQPINISPGIWHHAACRYVRDPTGMAVDITIVVNGNEGTPVRGGYSAPAGTSKMSIDVAEATFAGAIDELFFSTASTFGPKEIRKAWACGVDGRGCICQVNNPAKYESCGHAATCDELADCR